MLFFINGSCSNGTMHFLGMHNANETPLNTFLFKCNGISIELPPPNAHRVKNKAFRFSVAATSLNIQPDKNTINPYEVRVHSLIGNKTEVLFTGSFPVINDPKTSDLKFSFVSCNDNPATQTVQVDGVTNTYHNGIDEGMWDSVRLEHSHVIVHLGNNVYADSAWKNYKENKLDGSGAYEFIRQLYIATYASKAQGECMRHGMHIQMIDDHDFMNGYGGFYKADNGQVNDYALAVNEAHKEFMVQWQDPATWMLDVGKYRLAFLDTRGCFYKYRKRFPSELIEFTRETIDTCDQKIIVCLPQPLVHIDACHAKLMSWFHPDGHDESEFTCNREGAHELTSLLLDRVLEGRDVCVVAGDIHFGMIQTHTRDGVDMQELCCSPITRTPREAAPWYYQIPMWLQLHCGVVRLTTNVSNREMYTPGNNYGTLHKGQFNVVNRNHLLTAE
jgi:hypothetical protein